MNTDFQTSGGHFFSQLAWVAVQCRHGGRGGLAKEEGGSIPARCPELNELLRAPRGGLTTLSLRLKMSPQHAPILDYGVRRVVMAIRLQRLLWLLLFAGAVLLAPTTSMYVGWLRERPARQLAARVGGSFKCGHTSRLPLCDTLVPDRLGWMRARITELDLHGTAVADGDLRVIEDLSNLERLELATTAVSDAGVRHLGHLQALQSLDLSNTRISDAAMATIGQLRQLDTLILLGTGFSDAGAAELQSLSCLKALGLNGTAVTDTGVARLGSLTKMEALFLGNTQVTDAGLAHLTGMSQLELIDLGGTHVPDAGLAHLCQIPSLRHVYLNGTGVTYAGLSRLTPDQLHLEMLDVKDTCVTQEQAAELEVVLGCMVFHRALSERLP